MTTVSQPDLVEISQRLRKERSEWYKWIGEEKDKCVGYSRVAQLLKENDEALSRCRVERLIKSIHRTDTGYTYRLLAALGIRTNKYVEELTSGQRYALIAALESKARG